MIITRLDGGLGNQMFQYAMGRSMALARNTQLKLDLYSFEENDKRTFDLGQFKIQKQLATRQEIGKFKLPQTFLEKLLRPRNFVQEQENFTYNPDLFELRGDTHLVGYWVHKQYSAKYLPVIAQEFKVREQLLPQAQEVLTRIQTTNSLAIHVRLGDYYKDPKIKSMYQVCTPGYYLRALEQARSKIQNLTVFIFSDDIEIARQLLQLEGQVEYVKIMDEDQVGYASATVCEFELMRACKHIIISNSTFSWWAAYLGDYQSGMVRAGANSEYGKEQQDISRLVYTPNKWLNYKKVNLDAIIPAHWTQIAIEE